MILPNPGFSIVTVCLNDEPGLERTLQSVKAQTYRELEHIVIDGASTDGTRELALRHRDAITVFISEADAGIYYAMNKGLALCTRDFALFLNAGDALHDATVLADIAAAASEPHSMYFGRALMVAPRDRWSWPGGSVTTQNVGSWLRSVTPNHQCVFFPRELYRQERYDTALRIAADADYTRRAITRADGCTFVDRFVSVFQLGGLSSNADTLAVTYRHAYEAVIVANRYYSPKLLKATVVFLKFGAKYIISKTVGRRFFAAIKLLKRYSLP